LAGLAALAAVFIVTYGFSSYHQTIKPGRSVLVLALLLATPISLLYRRRFCLKHQSAAATHFFYIIGTAELASELQTLCKETHFPYAMRFIEAKNQAGILTEMQATESGQAGEDRALETLSQTLNKCEGVIIDLATCELDGDLAESLLAVNLHSAPVYPVELFIETFFFKIDLSHVSLASALDGTFIADHQKAYGRLKSLVDGFLAAVLLLVLLPLMLLISLIIKLEDFGPVFFIQERIGRFEEPFLLYKFRTMSVHHETDSQLYTKAGDPRITRFGQILRLMRLDELPQLWNVIKGEMSIIGPRAEWSKLVVQYEQQIPFYHLRHMVKPGVTGWAQVNYSYGASLKDTLEKLQYDLYYIKHYSLHMDASIVLKTIFTMLSASGR
jgi:exopolysaccharide biosynthesis polyprenyl glycosylphosphotransferase